MPVLNDIPQRKVTFEQDQVGIPYTRFTHVITQAHRVLKSIGRICTPSSFIQQVKIRFAASSSPGASEI